MGALKNTDLGRKEGAADGVAEVKLDMRHVGVGSCKVSKTAEGRSLLELLESISCAILLLNVKIRDYQFP